jgi:hypothetical protein
MSWCSCAPGWDGGESVTDLTTRARQPVAIIGLDTPVTGWYRRRLGPRDGAGCAPADRTVVLRPRGPRRRGDRSGRSHSHRHRSAIAQTGPRAHRPAVDLEIATEIFAIQLDNVVTKVQSDGIRLRGSPTPRGSSSVRCISDVEDGGRGIGNLLESNLINQLTRVLFDRDCGTGVEVTVTGHRRGDNDGGPVLETSLAGVHDDALSRGRRALRRRPRHVRDLCLRDGSGRGHRAESPGVARCGAWSMCRTAVDRNGSCGRQWSAGGARSRRRTPPPRSD